MSSKEDIDRLKEEFPKFIDLCKDYDIDIVGVEFDVHTENLIQRGTLELALSNKIVFNIAKRLPSDFLWVALDYDNKIVKDNLERSHMKVYPITGKSGHRWLPQGVKNPLNVLLHYTEDGTVNLVSEARHEAGSWGWSKAWNAKTRMKLADLRDLTDNRDGRSAYLIVMTRDPAITVKDIVSELYTIVPRADKEYEESKQQPTSTLYPDVPDLPPSPLPDKAQEQLNKVVHTIANGSSEAISKATANMPPPIRQAILTTTQAAVNGELAPPMPSSVPQPIQEGIKIATAIATGAPPSDVSSEDTGFMSGLKKLVGFPPPEPEPEPYLPPPPPPPVDLPVPRPPPVEMFPPSPVVPPPPPPPPVMRFSPPAPQHKRQQLPPPPPPPSNVLSRLQSVPPPAVVQQPPTVMSQLRQLWKPQTQIPSGEYFAKVRKRSIKRKSRPKKRRRGTVVPRPKKSKLTWTQRRRPLSSSEVIISPKRKNRTTKRRKTAKNKRR